MARVRDLDRVVAVALRAVERAVGPRAEVARGRAGSPVVGDVLAQPHRGTGGELRLRDDARGVAFDRRLHGRGAGEVVVHAAGQRQPGPAGGERQHHAGPERLGRHRVQGDLREALVAARVVVGVRRFVGPQLGREHHAGGAVEHGHLVVDRHELTVDERGKTPRADEQARAASRLELDLAA